MKKYYVIGLLMVALLMVSACSPGQEMAKQDTVVEKSAEMVKPEAKQVVEEPVPEPEMIKEEESMPVKEEMQIEEPESKQMDDLKPAPEFSATTITGETVSLQSFKDSNKPSIVYFTASWCPLCAQNWPSLNEVYDEYKDEVNFVAISIDPTDTAEVMTRLAEEKGLMFPIVPGSPDIMVDFGVNSQATTVGLNAAGKIVFVKNKQKITAQQYRELIDQLQ